MTTVPGSPVVSRLSTLFLLSISAVDPNGDTTADNESLVASSRFKNRDYIELPLALKYKIGLPLVGKVLSPYVFTGPTFAFLASKKGISEAYENKSFDCAWNFGVGLQFFAQPIDGKNNYWTITAAWLF